MAAAAAATTASKWPRIGDRYFRPETIISIDVERSDAPRWTGSTGAREHLDFFLKVRPAPPWP